MIAPGCETIKEKFSLFYFQIFTISIFIPYNSFCILHLKFCHIRLFVLCDDHCCTVQLYNCTTAAQLYNCTTVPLLYCTTQLRDNYGEIALRKICPRTGHPCFSQSSVLFYDHAHPTSVCPSFSTTRSSFFYPATKTTFWPSHPCLKSWPGKMFLFASNHGR